jgi:hypothetical protein
LLNRTLQCPTTDSSRLGAAHIRTAEGLCRALYVALHLSAERRLGRTPAGYRKTARHEATTSLGIWLTSKDGIRLQDEGLAMEIDVDEVTAMTTAPPATDDL